MSLVLVTPPVGLPLTLAELKAQSRITDYTDDDALIIAYLRASIAVLEDPEGFYGRALLTQTWDFRFDAWPVTTATMDGGRTRVRLPLEPLQSVSAVTYIDSAGDEVILGDYHVTGVGGVGQVYPAFSTTWPTVQALSEAVTVRFVAGYGDDANDVPENIRLALMLMVAELICDREGEMGMGEGIRGLLAPYRRAVIA